MAQDADEQIKNRKTEAIDAELERFKEAYYKCSGKEVTTTWI